MPRLLFTCSYDGVGYHGWQSQRGGATLQDTIETAIASIVGERVRIAASGRTDAGVHAVAQCFHLDVPPCNRMNEQQWVAALNAHLPPSIRILQAIPVDNDFHARFNAIGKVYEYRICRDAVLSPFLHGRVWHVPGECCVDTLAAAMRVYEGTHDFRRFAAARGNEPVPPPPGFYERTLYTSELQVEPDGMLRLRFHGNGFMYRMVRMLVGTAHQVARGRLSLSALNRMFIELDAPKTRFCAPPEGLYLRQVFYPASLPSSKCPVG